jgi:predicted nucleotide-binding protein (sugar kinase/HSP70/actin superfamily)
MKIKIKQHPNLANAYIVPLDKLKQAARTLSIYNLNESEKKIIEIILGMRGNKVTLPKPHVKEFGKIWKKYQKHLTK